MLFEILPKSAIENDECVLIGSPFANAMQAVVAISAVFILVSHRAFVESGKCIHTDRSPRPWKTWFLDNAKQGVSSFVSHFWGTFAAIVLAGWVGRKTEVKRDECAWFLAQFIIDTLLGVYLTIVIHRWGEWIASKSDRTQCLSRTGVYTDVYNGPSYKIWFAQLIHWVFSSLLARVFCSLVLVVLFASLSEATRWFSNKFRGNRHLELIFVVILFPLVLDSVQFLWQNAVLRAKQVQRPRGGVLHGQGLLDDRHDDNIGSL